jgi:Ca2+-binding RTX toxin-like protein
LVLTLSNGADGVTVQNWFGEASGRYQVERVEFADGTQWSSSALSTTARVTSSPTLTGTSGADTLSGGNGSDSLDGLAGDDILFGADGNDILFGGAGNDTLIGGAGDDVFRFDLLSSSDDDLVADFTGAGQVGGDVLGLDVSVFATLSPGALPASAFQSDDEDRAQSASVRIIYDTRDGGLYYDADGNELVSDPGGKQAQEWDAAIASGSSLGEVLSTIKRPRFVPDAAAVAARAVVKAFHVDSELGLYMLLQALRAEP